jgi:hypothetical protein
MSMLWEDISWIERTIWAWAEYGQNAYFPKPLIAWWLPMASLRETQKEKKKTKKKTKKTKKKATRSDHRAACAPAADRSASLY